MYQWNWSVLLAPDYSGQPYILTLLLGLKWTLLVGLPAWILALGLGAVVGIARTWEGGVISRLASVYVETLRSIPLIVQMFLWFYVAPDLLPDHQAQQIKSWSEYNVFAASICLALFTSARIAEQVRAGILSIPRGQFQAAQALGLVSWQSYRYVLMPVATRKIIPALTNEFVTIIKNTSVAFTIAVVELMAATRSLQETTFQVFEAFTVATLIYLSVNLCVVKFMGGIERYMAVPGLASGSRK